MVALIQEILEFVSPAFTTAGYFVIAGAILADRSIFLGVVIPGDLFLALGGIFAAQGELSLPVLIPVAVGAALVGESVGYWLGSRYGARFIRHLPLMNRLERKLDEARDFFSRHGGKAVFIGRYATVAGVFVPFVAGMAEMPYGKFLLVDIVGVTLWATGVTLLGYFLNSQVDLVDQILSQFGWAVLGLVVIFFLGRFFWNRHREKTESGSGSRTRSRSRGSSSRRESRGRHQARSTSKS
jgi:membrane-associated protein